MADFAPALLFVLKNEGSVFTNNACDEGGPTRFGVTLQTLQSLHPGSEAADVESLTSAQAEDIYRQVYWQPLRLDEVNDQATATATLDAAVLLGVKRAAVILQQSFYAPVDGRIGSKSLEIINRWTKSSQRSSCALTFLEFYQDYLATRVCARPENLRFLRGWMMRTRKILSLFFSERSSISALT